MTSAILVRSGGFIAYAVCLLFCPACLAQSLELSHIQSLIASGHATEAYGLLQPYEMERAGDPQFDYLLGLSALESGDPGKATVIFERVLAVDPGFLGARLDLARAHFLLGDRATAKTEFEALRAQNPPLAARNVITTYLHAIGKTDDVTSSSLATYFEIGTGYDTNINNSTSQRTIAVPALVNALFTLDSKNVKKSAGYASWEAGANIDRKIQPGVSLYAAANLRNRIPPSEHDFRYLAADAVMGVAFDGNGETVKLGIQGGGFSLGDHLNRETVGANSEWKHVVNAHNQASLFSQYVVYRFPSPDLVAYNFNQFIAGAGWLHGSDRATTALFASLYAGEEHATKGRADGNKQLFGVRVGYQYRLGPSVDIVASSGAQYGYYDRRNPAFLVNRQDKLFDLSVALPWRLNGDWTLRPQFAAIKNNSNLAINKFDGMDVSLHLHRDFK